MMRLRYLLIAVLIAGDLPVSAQKMALHDGDRIVFYGDSITAQRLYTRFVEDFVLTRYPRMHIQFFNAGVPGDTVQGGYTGDMPIRLKRDLFPHQPTVVTVMLGMNDGYYMPFDKKYLAAYRDGYGHLLTAIQVGAPNALLTLISPTPYDELTHGTEFVHYGSVVDRYAASVKEVAASSHLGFSDFHQAITNLTAASMEKNPALAALLIPDRIHPGEAAHWVMAAQLARSWGISPIVSRVHVDIQKMKIAEADNTIISALDYSNGILKWTQLDEALPLPLPLENAVLQLVLGTSDLLSMDQQILRVEGLPASQYMLKIDGRPISSFKREQLTDGINLAQYPTPMQSQAKDVDGMELKRSRLDEAYFILSLEEPKASDVPEVVRSIRAKDAALESEQHKISHPVSHHFELIPE